MLTTTKIMSSAALGLALACLAPVAGHASEVSIPAAGCTEVAITAATSTATTARAGGGFAVSGGTKASLLCPVPTDELDSSSGGGDDDSDRLTFRVIFLDSDGAGSGIAGATVSAGLYRTTLSATDPVVDTRVCGPAGPLTVNTANPGSPQAIFSCPRLVKNAFYHLKVDLASTTGTTAAFAGVVAED